MLWTMSTLLLCSAGETTMLVQVSAEISICPTDIGSYCAEIVHHCAEMGIHLGE